MGLRGLLVNDNDNDNNNGANGLASWAKGKRPISSERSRREFCGGRAVEGSGWVEERGLKRGSGVGSQVKAEQQRLRQGRRR